MPKEHVTVKLDTVKQIGFERLSEDVDGDGWVAKLPRNVLFLLHCYPHQWRSKEAWILRSLCHDVQVCMWVGMLAK